MSRGVEGCGARGRRSCESGRAMRFAGKRADHTSLRPSGPSSTPWTIECRPVSMRPRMNNTALCSPPRHPSSSLLLDGTPVSCTKPSGRLVYLMSSGSVVGGASRCTDSSDVNPSHSSYVITTCRFVTTSELGSFSSFARLSNVHSRSSLVYFIAIVCLSEYCVAPNNFILRVPSIRKGNADRCRSGKDLRIANVYPSTGCVSETRY